MRTLPLWIAICFLSLAACKGKKNEKGAESTAAEPAASEDAREAPPEPVEAAEAGDDQINKMANCPSAVAGATTEVKNIAGGVLVTVKGGDEAEIRKRAATLAALSAPAEGDIAHTGQGTGGGSLGKCPVVMKEATLTVEDIDGGAAITVVPKSGDAADVEQLQRVAAERAAALAAESGADTGAVGGQEEAAPKADSKRKRAPMPSAPARGGAPSGGEDKMDATEEEDDPGM